jgi:hypothetical protein
MNRSQPLPVDSYAIAFGCRLNDQLERMGYVVREALNAVHAAMVM